MLLCDDNYIVMQRNVLDDTYLEKLINLVEENPALYDTSLNEYIKTASELGTFGTIIIAEAMDVRRLCLDK